MKRTYLKKGFFACAFSFFLLVSCNQKSQEQTPTEEIAEEAADSMNEETLTSNSAEMDAAFLVDAAQINHHEIVLGELAQTKSKTTIVKDFAKMMVKEHSKSLNDLKALAAKKSITLPEPVKKEEVANYADFSAKTGKEFDNAYCDAMVDGHKKAIEKFEHASTAATDPDIKAWATTVLPVLRTHLQHAEECQKKCAAM